MSEEDNSMPGGIVKQTIDSVTGLTKAVPIYEDAIQPFAKETGRALGTVGKAVNLALEPLSGIVWGYEQIKQFVELKVADRLKHLPPERIATPNPSVAGPALEALKYNGHDTNLRELYATLLATSLDKESAHKAHPGFVEILKSMNSNEAKLMNEFIGRGNHPIVDLCYYESHCAYKVIVRNASDLGKSVNCKFTELTPSYLDNLCRLGLLEIRDEALDNNEIYTPIENRLKPVVDAAPKGLTGRFKRKNISITDLGKQFADACIIIEISFS